MSSNKSRKRSSLLGKIRQQMEFYFSDASLSKDRFLQEKIKQSEDGYVPVSLFLSFNKLRSLTTEESLIREAVKTSSLLQLSEDGSKLKRCVPINSDLGPVDERTLYAENIPMHADHEWLKSKFSVFGPVQYISLPKFKALKTIKGFAFIEFDSPAAVQRACEYFALPSADSQPMFAKEADLPSVPIVTIQDFDEDEISAAHGTKRRHDDVDTETPALLPSNVSAESKRHEGEVPVAPKPMYRLQTKPKGAPSKPNAPILDLRPLKVMPKTQWMELKKRYLDLQKASYRAIKQKLNMLNVGDDDQSESNGMKDDVDLMMDSDDDEMSEVSVDKVKPQSPHRRVQAQKRPQKLSAPTNSPVKSTEKSVNQVLGAILHWTLSTPMEDRKKLIQDVRTIKHVEFVDVQNPTEVIVRCATAEGAKEVREELMKRDSGNVIRILEGDEEKAYWTKIESDMKKRSVMGKQRRGKAKVVANAEEEMESVVKGNIHNRLHIKFE
ncbi:la-related protein 7-like isoform X2 [Paramacrobiotus metropolitanus]|uniref:la-related protein 7-like isoform X2 n=1 Tax=Paramacrobiotus metropolitanus TaxID=2943436 RepID=UPI002445AB79|nr:la-related protein 7-like isoform X2 [Paramacrobiotus metropolitanus]